jgi:hypothetical protein
LGYTILFSTVLRLNYFTFPLIVTSLSGGWRRELQWVSGIPQRGPNSTLTLSGKMCFSLFPLNACQRKSVDDSYVGPLIQQPKYFF